MTTALRAAFASVGLAPRGKLSETVSIREKEPVVIRFHCDSYLIPKGIQVAPCGVRTAGQSSKQHQLFEDVRIDLDALMGRCSIDCINVHEDNGHCIVYVNCIAERGAVGFGCWNDGVYGDFVRKLFSYPWKKAVVNQDDDRTVVTLSKKCDVVKTKIRFAIK